MCMCCCLASRISSSPLALFSYWEDNFIWWGGAPMKSKGFPGPSNFTFYFLSCLVDLSSSSKLSTAPVYIACTPLCVISHDFKLGPKKRRTFLRSVLL